MHLNRKPIVAFVIVSASMCAVSADGVGDFTEGPFNTAFADLTNWGPENLILPQFDEMGGARVLTQVTVDWIAGVFGSVQVESLDSEPSVITATLAADITLVGPSGFSENPMPMDVGIFNATGFDGTVDFAGTSGQTFPNLAGNEAGQIVFTIQADLNPFIGAGNVIFMASATSTSSVTSPGNVIAAFMTNASASVSVTYGYIVPAPGAMAILGISFVLSGVRRRR